MADEKKNEGEKSGAEKANELTLTHKGHTLNVTLEKATELAQKGMNYEQKMAQLKEERAAIQRDAEQFAAYEQLKAHLQQHPEHAQAWQRIVAGEKVRFEGDPPANGRAAAAGGAGKTTQSGDPDRLAKVEAELERVTSLMQNQQVANQQAALGSRMEAEVAQYPHVQGDQAKSMVKSMALQYMQANPGESVDAAMAVAASQFGAALKGAQQAELDRSRDSDFQRIGRGRDGGLPALTEEETPTMEDMKSGKLREKAANIFAKLGLEH